MKYLAILIGVCMLVFPLSLHAGYQVGDTVDDFTLSDAGGVPHSLYDYAGRIIVLDFYRDT